MPRIDFLIFGYRRVFVKKEECGKLLNLLLANGISVKIRNSSFLVSEGNFKKIESLLKGKIEYSASGRLGLVGFLDKYKRRYGVIAAILISLFLSVFSTSRVWDIRIDGTRLGNEDEIIEELSEVGFRVGTSWWGLDKSRVEADMLAKSKTVSWININQRGTVAYVSVIDKIAFENDEEKTGFCNVVATRDAIIEEITVKSGYATVKAGQTVKKGEILISGVIPQELGGGFCYAEGVVIGRFSDEIIAEVSENGSEKSELTREFIGININFFDFSFKILEKYRKTEEEYAIIKDKRNFNFLNAAKLPFSYDVEYLVIYEDCEKRYSKSEMIFMAKEKMEKLLSEALADKDLLKIKTEGSFREASYVLVSEYVASGEIGKTVAFDVVR